MEHLRENSLRDPMTGLYNRRFLEDYVGALVSSSQRRKASFSALMLDLDFFKQVNDTHGHEAGDKVIKTLADLLAALKRDPRKVLIGVSGTIGSQDWLKMPVLGRSLDDMLDYLRRSPGVRDVVVSGGDVANMPWPRLEEFVSQVLEIDNIRDTAESVVFPVVPDGHNAHIAYSFGMARPFDEGVTIG